NSSIRASSASTDNEETRGVIHTLTHEWMWSVKRYERPPGQLRIYFESSRPGRTGEKILASEFGSDTFRKNSAWPQDAGIMIWVNGHGGDGL
ncbi:MAG: hypothetical protein WA418_15095, partial [Bradyrhizobium sp.]